MSEGTHSPSPARQPLWKNKLVLGVGTAAVAIVVTGVAMQMVGSRESQAKPDMAPAGKARPSGVYVARVGSALVSKEELAEECIARYGQEVLENIVNRMVIQQACAEANVTVSESEVNTEIRKIAKRFGIPVDTWLKMLQEERGLTPAQYQRDVIWPMLALKKLARAEIGEVAEADLKKAFVRDYGPRVKAKMIMLDNLRRAQSVWEEVVKAPNDFERLARKYSIEPNSRSLGGAIPPIRMYAGNDTLEKKAYALKPGEISGIIQVGFDRYVILLCEGRTQPLVTDLNEVREELTDLIREEKVQTAVATKFDEIKARTRVDNYLTNTSYGGEIRQTSGTRPAPSTTPPTTATGRQPLEPAREAAQRTSPFSVSRPPSSGN